MKIEDLKTKAYGKNKNLEKLLNKMNRFLLQLDGQSKNVEADSSIYPSIFIVGAPRSGTTLLSQYLACTGNFCYPIFSNFQYKAI